jgi:polyisoprenoid-binding protein YceI
MSAATATTAQQLAGGTWKIDKVHSHVGFAIKHMVVSTFRGSFDEYSGALVAGEDAAPRLEGAVRVDSINVKDENLAAHLKSPEFFDTASYPEIRFVSTEVSLAGDGELEVVGDLTIRDRTHRVSARGSVTGPHTDIAGNDKLGVELEASIDRREYGLEYNAQLPKGGLALDNDVKLSVSLELVKEA